MCSAGKDISQSFFAVAVYLHNVGSGCGVGF